MPNRWTTTGWLLSTLAMAWCGVAAAQPSTTALTVSGWPSAPEGERSTTAAAVGVRFQAPATVELASAYLAWRRNTGGCRVALAVDDGGAPGPELAGAPVPPGAGWQAMPLPASLVAGEF